MACRQVIAQHSRSFALASTLLGPVARDHAAAVYAWCRGADDAIDLAPADRVAAALAEERADAADYKPGKGRVAQPDKPGAQGFKVKPRGDTPALRTKE